ncbi:hypothetical protein Glove_296g69 [Diversispora epigaea]|uniref:Zinc-ribbon domain-containing protein n=1 Tax=Diversispora epigaea TaxID=1348612 RepID=A0A397HYZ7_9GLOM|nr:hypothetical protein Glove_296g69 [Diversispora epigaea]
MQLKITLNDACTIARARGGLCLSDKFINSKIPLRWKCSKDHEWNAPLDRIKNRNTWCPVCAGQPSFHLEIAKKNAIDRGGLCLSTQCTATKELLQWRCSRGHEWSATYNNVIHNKNWCMKCSYRNPCTPEKARKIAHDRNGECLSGKFINNELPLLWHFAVGHEWNACLSNVKNKNSWCPHCVGGRPRYTLEDARKIAHDRNGKCLSENSSTAICHYYGVVVKIVCNRNGESLSTSYFNNYSDLLWKCAKGHTWYAPLREVKNQNNWCPFCRLHKRENLCREIVLKYLELDIYYSDYGIAIEVRGQQHEKYIEFFHRGDNNFIKQQNSKHGINSRMRKLDCFKVCLVL